MRPRPSTKSSSAWKKPVVVFRNLRRLVRTGAGRQNQADAGEEFCEDLLSSDPPPAFSLTIGEGGARQAFRNRKVRESSPAEARRL